MVNDNSISLYPFPFRITLLCGGSGPHLIHGSLCPPESKSTSQTTSGSVHPFLQRSRSWQTDHTTGSAAIDCICIELWRGLIMVIMMAMVWWCCILIGWSEAVAGENESERANFSGQENSRPW